MSAYDTADERAKKYFVPLIVLLLCGVAVTSAGYAYSSQLENGTLSGTDATYFQIALDDNGSVAYETVFAGTVLFDQKYDAEEGKSTFVTAGNEIGTFGTQIDDAKSNHTTGYKIDKVTVTCVEDEKLVFTAEVSEDGHSFTISIAKGQVPSVNPAKDSTYTLKIHLEATAN